MNFRVPCLLLGASTLICAANAQLKTMQPDDYKGWEAISTRDLSDDGRWLWYQIALVDGDGYLTIKNNDDKRMSKIPNATGAAFSDDSKWVAYLIVPPKAVADKMREEHKPIEPKMALRNLETGGEQIFEAVAAFRFVKGSHTLLAQRTSLDPRPDAGRDLLIIDLATSTEIPISQVSEEATSDDGTMIAVSTKTQAGDQSLELFDTKTNTIKPLLYGKKNIRRISWAKNNHALAFLQGKASEDRDGDFNDLAEVTGLPDKPALHVLEPTGKPWLPASRRVSEAGGLEISDDGSVVAFGIGDWLLKHKPDDKAHPEVWNSKDLRVVPEQRVEAGEDRARTDLAFWRPATDSVTKVTDGWQEAGYPLFGLQTAVVQDGKPYMKPANNGIEYRDVSLVDTATGTRKLVLAKTEWPVFPSRKGRYLAYYKLKNWWICDTKTGISRNATASTGADFENEEDDHTVPEKPEAAPPEWLADDKGLIVADDFDSFLIRPEGGVTQLTHGRKENLVYRFLSPRVEEDGPDIAKPFYFSLFDKHTKQSGFYVSDATGKGKVLAADSARMGGLKLAKHSDRVVFTMGSYVNSPNLYITNPAFSQIKPETKTNPQQAKFYWPQVELVDYKSRWGKPLQGILIYPANYQKGRIYPMITYIYERLSDNLNSYLGPNPANPYNPQILSQNGYFVFEPDIAYKGNTPGENAVDCLEPAVAAVLAKNVGVNPARVGLMGHSWGAYQTAYVTTVSSVFRVGAAGAPLTDLVSMYNTHYWNSGISNAPILESSQGRLRVPFWEDPKTYIDNSPVWQSMKRKAPILITVGDQDGAVDYHQGIALYNTLRRMGKDCILLVYYGENHNFTKRPDQLDYGARLRHFMDVYLKDAKPEPWISQGIPFIKKDDSN